MISTKVYGESRPDPVSDAIEGITYDPYGRMQYHPEFHENHGKPFTEDDKEYLCMFYEIDNTRALSYAIGKTEVVLRAKYSILKRQGKVEFYRERFLQKLKG